MDQYDNTRGAAVVTDRAIPSRLGGGAIGKQVDQAEQTHMQNILGRISELTNSAEVFAGRVGDTAAVAENIADTLLGAVPLANATAVQDSLFSLPPYDSNDGMTGVILQALDRLSDVLRTAEARRDNVDRHHRRLRSVA